MYPMFAPIDEMGNLTQFYNLLLNQMPLTLIYGNLETIAECFVFFSNSMVKDQYYPSTALPLAKNRLSVSTMHSTLSMNETFFWLKGVQQYKTFEPFHSGTPKKTILPVMYFFFN